MTTGFVKAKCAKCKNEQMIFGRPSTEVRCLVCGETLAKPSGGKGIMAAPKAEKVEKVEKAGKTEASAEKKGKTKAAEKKAEKE
ncbi:MAG: 30S ribosomal protein S27e [Candidatus Aenigmarchaeota archaeon]|nr:30S ribosomal protein S27e [Candidatus Aenigmarchaeota archaeon]